MDSHALASELATWRASMDSFAADFRERCSENDQVIDRTELVAVDIQRLEWALASFGASAPAKALHECSESVKLVMAV